MKILVFGPPGAGKTTFCNQLSKKVGIPVFHIDRHFFHSCWSKRPREDFLRDCAQEMEKEQWLIDGNGMATIESRYQEATHAIWLSAPRLVCFYRIFKRWLTTIGKHKPDGPEGAANSVSFRMLRYLWRYKRKYTPLINELRERYPEVKFTFANGDSVSNLV